MIEQRLGILVKSMLCCTPASLSMLATGFNGLDRRWLLNGYDVKFSSQYVVECDPVVSASIFSISSLSTAHDWRFFGPPCVRKATARSAGN